MDLSQYQGISILFTIEMEKVRHPEMYSSDLNPFLFEFCSQWPINTNMINAMKALRPPVAFLLQSIQIPSQKESRLTEFTSVSRNTNFLNKCDEKSNWISKLN